MSTWMSFVYLQKLYLYDSTCKTLPVYFPFYRQYIVALKEQDEFIATLVRILESLSVSCILVKAGSILPTCKHNLTLNLPLSYLTPTNSTLYDLVNGE